MGLVNSTIGDNWTLSPQGLDAHPEVLGWTSVELRIGQGGVTLIKGDGSARVFLEQDDYEPTQPPARENANLDEESSNESNCKACNCDACQVERQCASFHIYGRACFASRLMAAKIRVRDALTNAIHAFLFNIITRTPESLQQLNDAKRCYEIAVARRDALTEDANIEVNISLRPLRQQRPLPAPNVKVSRAA